MLPKSCSCSPGQNDRLFADDIFICIFVNEKFCILIEISLKCVPKGQIYNNTALVQIIAWCGIGDKPLSHNAWVNSVPPYVRKLHFMYEVVRTLSKCHWSIYRKLIKCRWSIYHTSRERRETLRVVHKVERSSPTVYPNQCWHDSLTHICGTRRGWRC